jgi:hypothetical protein
VPPCSPGGRPGGGVRGAKSSGVYREEASGLHASQLVSSEAVFSSQRALSELGHNASAAERVSVEEHHGEFCIARQQQQQQQLPSATAAS